MMAEMATKVIFNKIIIKKPVSLELLLQRETYTGVGGLPGLGLEGTQREV